MRLAQESRARSELSPVLRSHSALQSAAWIGRRSTRLFGASLFCSTAAMLSQAAADDTAPTISDDTQLAYYATPPDVPDGNFIRWQGAIAIAVPLPVLDLSVASTEAIHLQYTVLSESLLYTKRMATAARLRFPDASLDPTPISVTIVDQLRPLQRRIVSAMATTLGIVRRDASGRPLCSLLLTWHKARIQLAWIEIESSVTPDEANRCLKELIWRAFGFPGHSESEHDWVDERLSEERKLELVKQLYGRP